MNSSSSEHIAQLVSKIVEDQFNGIEVEARERIEERFRSLDAYESKVRSQIEATSQDMTTRVRTAIDSLAEYEASALSTLRERAEQVEERVTRDVRTRIFAVAALVVAIAAGTLLVGSFASTREVNASVIALQKDIISAQTTVRSAADALIEQKTRLAEAQATLNTVTSELQDARQQLTAVTGDLQKARDALQVQRQPAVLEK